MWIHWPFFPKTWTKGHWPLDDLWPMSVEVTCVTLPKDHCVQVPWQYINVCGYSDQFCKIPHTYYILRTYYGHTTYRMSDHIVSYWTRFRRDKNCCCCSITTFDKRLGSLWHRVEVFKLWVMTSIWVVSLGCWPFCITLIWKTKKEQRNRKLRKNKRRKCILVNYC